MMRFLLPLLVLPAGALLSGCCCCNLSSWIPDDVEEAVLEQAVESGVEAATGAEIDAKEGRFELQTEEGKMVFGEGHSGVDPRIPIVGHPDCPVAGGLAAEANGEFNGTMVQSDCTVPYEELEAYYVKQFEALGAKPDQIIQGVSSGNRGKILQASNHDRFKTLSVVIAEEEGGKTSAIVNVVVATAEAE